MIDITKIKPNDILAVIHYVKVTNLHNSGLELIAEDTNKPGKPIRIQGKDILEQAASADQYAKEEFVSKTHAAELLISSHNKPFTVCFDKADGKERILRGRLISPEPLLGRSTVEDLDLATNNIRLVDHRTIHWLIVDNVKHTVN